MDDGLAGRHRDAEIRLREAAADAEDEVALLEEVMHRRRDREAARAERQRVRFGKRALALQAGGDRNGEQLGELLQLAPGFRPVHALARIEHRALGGEQHFRGFAHRIGIGTGAQRPRDDVVGRVGFLVPHVVRHLDQHRPAAPGAQPREGAAHDRGQLLARRDRLGRLGDAAHLDAGIVVALDPGEPARIAARHHQDRHRLAPRLRDAAIGVLGAGAVLHHEHAEIPAAGHARHRFGHVQPDALLAHDDRPDAGGRAALEDVVDRIADHGLDALAAQDVGDGVGDFHGCFPLCVGEA